MFVANPYAEKLTFPDRLTRMRRDHMKYLTLIRTIALLHQHQRPVKSERGISYIEVTGSDIETADRLMKELLARSLDELPPQTRCLLGLIGKMAAGRAGFSFSRRDVREHTGWGATQVRVHLDRLQEMEYLMVHRGGRGQTFLYVYEYDSNLAGSEGQLAGSKRPHNGGVAGAWRAAETRMNTAPNGVLPQENKKRIATGA